ncbi:hypothetical protein [Methylomonas rhizoryzae]|uniref:hypothetical protein n=1 Tax=Methylomonas rhizoryzae TaxID=2608981 RepID=UPI001231F056|nr:hypothetical protein [Methylomonas rhizoryzae]
MTETIPEYALLTEEKEQQANRAAKLAFSIEHLTQMLSDQLWNDDDWKEIKNYDRITAMVDACNAAAKELSELIG